MDLNQEIRKLFALSTNNSAIKIDCLPSPYEAWVIRLGNEYGVGIPIDEEMKISERFSGARIWTAPMFIQNQSLNLLMLTSQDNELRMEFSAICSQFVDPGKNGEDRKRLLESPFSWWEKWRNLLGNSVTNKSAHGVLGELITLRYLSDKGLNPIWTGGGKTGVHDIATETMEYEVKSTTMRYESIISVSGQFQLQSKSSKSLSLIFCRFESSPMGESIDDIVIQLANKGFDMKSLEDGLARYGFEAGCSARLETYKLLEMREYIVDNAFPRITMQSFVGGKLPEAVIQLTYRLDLTGIPYKSWID
jgi:hypothetical protein